MDKINYLLIIILIICSCKDKIEPVYNNVTTYEKTYFEFKEGSYWIYLNEYSQKYDTFTVRRLSYGEENIRNDDGDIIEYYDFVNCFLDKNNIFITLNNSYLIARHSGIYYLNGWYVNFKLVDSRV
jgi:hypothetical protein